MSLSSQWRWPRLLLLGTGCSLGFVCHHGTMADMLCLCDINAQPMHLVTWDFKSMSALCELFSNPSRPCSPYLLQLSRPVLREIYAVLYLAHGAIGHAVAPTALFKLFDTEIQPSIHYSNEVCYDRKVPMNCDANKVRIWMSDYIPLFKLL